MRVRMPRPRLLLRAFLGLILSGFLLVGALYVQETRVAEIPLPGTADSRERGNLLKVERVGRFGALSFRALVWWGGLPVGGGLDCGATLYRVQYWTVRHDGAPTPVSGLVAIPATDHFRGVVSYQHGTNPDRTASPSRPSIGEGVLGAAVFSGSGYVFTAPDYVGLGASHEVHTYLHCESTASAVVDLLRAARSLVAHLGGDWPESVYLMGVSQGGHATLAAQRLLEGMHDPSFHVVASAPVSGAYDLLGISFPTALGGASSAHSLYLAWLVNSYCTVYKHPLETVLVGSCAKAVPGLFDGEHDGDAICAALPPRSRALFCKPFLDSYERHETNWFLDALAKNEVLNWTPEAPVRLYYGENDIDVSPKEAHAAFKAFSDRGCDVRLVSVGQCDHGESIMRSVPKVLGWFDEISTDSGTSP